MVGVVVNVGGGGLRTEHVKLWMFKPPLLSVRVVGGGVCRGGGGGGWVAVHPTRGVLWFNVEDGLGGGGVFSTGDAFNFLAFTHNCIYR